MKAKLPLIRAFIYLIVTIFTISGMYFTVHDSLSEEREDIQKARFTLAEKQDKLDELSSEQHSLSSRLSKLNAQADETGKGKKILINKTDLSGYLFLQALADEVEITHIKDIDFEEKNETWEVKYNIGIQGSYRNVLDFIDAVSKIGKNYFAEEINIYQSGPLGVEDPKGEWTDNEDYLSYDVEKKNGLNDFYYAGGSISFPILIETPEGARPFLRLKDIVYSGQTINRYDWQIDEARILIGDTEYGLGYPKVDFNKQELRLNIDFELKESMIGSEVKGIGFNWRSLNKEHEAFLFLQRPIIITEEMFSESPWMGEVNEEIIKANLDMLNSVIYTDFNIVFLMDEVPDVYFEKAANQIDRIKDEIQNNAISVPDNETLVIHEEEVKTYKIKDNNLFLNNEPLFELNTGQFVLNDKELIIELNILNDISYNLSFEEVKVFTEQ